jgi:Tfp pilus assembly protein PilF
MSEETARKLRDQAYEMQMSGDLVGAIDLYTRSIRDHPTAEAYTFRGWTYSFLRDLDHAIADCKRAIEIDPAFGNPYNDIGVYLIDQGKPDEALPWLEKAIKAPRYESRCFPWANLARIYEAKAEWNMALIHFQRSLQENPTYPVARSGISRLRSLMN